MPDPSDDKIEQLVRSVLAAVDARLQEVRNELHELAGDVEQRHRETLQHMQDLERRLERRAADGATSTTGGDPLAARMEQATQVLLERIEAMHQRNTIATNERFALINLALEQIRGDNSAAAITVPVMPSLDEMNAPLRVGPITASQPVVAVGMAPSATRVAPSPPPFATHPPIAPVSPAPTATAAPATTATAGQATIDPPTSTAPAATTSTATPSAPPALGSGEIDLAQLADLLGERLGHLNIAQPPS